jgi:hypothetical protein
MPLNGLAASMNHCISLIWSSRDSADGWNSLSTHRSAAAMSALADVTEAAIKIAAAAHASFRMFLSSLKDVRLFAFQDSFENVLTVKRKILLLRQVQMRVCDFRKIAAQTGSVTPHDKPTP